MDFRREGWKCVLLTAATVLWSSAATAQAIIRNYPPDNDSQQISIDDLSVAVGFTMPAGAGIPLPPVRVRLSVSSAVTSFEADLFGDAGGAPTAPILVSFTDPPALPVSVPANTCDDFILTPASPFTLQPSTTYWLRLRGTAPAASGHLRWCASNPEKAYSGIATSAGEFQNNTDPPTSNIGGGSLNNPTYQVGDVVEQISVVEIPVLGPWGLAALAALLTVAAAIALRRRLGPSR